MAAAEDNDTSDGSATIRLSASGLSHVDVTATEDDDAVTLTVNNDGNGSTSPSGAITVDPDASTAISATAAAGYTFNAWTGDTTGIGSTGDASTTISPTGGQIIQATFTANTVNIVPSSTSVTVGEGGSQTFTVTLSAQPTSSITVAVARNSGDGDISVSGGSSLIFTTSNWDDAQMVTLAAAEDSDTSDGSATIHLSASGLSHVDVTATEDDDAVTLTVNNDGNGSTSPSGATTVDPDASTAISATPAAGYTFNAWTGDTTGIGSTGDASTTISPTGDQTIQATFTANTVTIVPSSISVEVDEGSTATFTVVLSAQPASSVTVNVAHSSGDTDISVSGGTSLTFTISNWDDAQTVTLAAAEDGDTSDDSATITLSATGLTDVDVTATEDDNDNPGITVTGGPSTTTENGGTDTISVVLNTLPTDTVTIAVASSDTGEGAVSPTTLTFTTANWDTAQDVTITGVDDSTVDGDQSYDVTLNASSSDGDYDPLSETVSATNTDDAVTLTVTSGTGGSTNLSGGNTVDPDSATAITATAAAGYTFNAWAGDTTGIGSTGDASTTISPTGDQVIQATFTENTVTIVPSSTSVTVNEGGSQTFTVTLSAQPTSSVTVMFLEAVVTVILW